MELISSTPSSAVNAFAVPALLSIAPMVGITHQYARYFYRMLSPKTQVYTEMINVNEIIHGSGFEKSDPVEHPNAIQLAGEDPILFEKVTQRIESLGYDEININCGCPSPRVQAGNFGASLMLRPDRVSECIRAMTHQSAIPVTVKCRLGVEPHEGPDVYRFIEKIAEAGCRKVIIHARYANLNKNTRYNLDHPSLDYTAVYQIKKYFPELHIGINGKIETIEQVREHLLQVDSVMLGRAIWHKPLLLAELDREIYKNPQPTPSRLDLFIQYMNYVQSQYQKGAPSHILFRPILGLLHGQPQSKKYRCLIGETRIHSFDELISFQNQLFEFVNVSN